MWRRMDGKSRFFFVLKIIGCIIFIWSWIVIIQAGPTLNKEFFIGITTVLCVVWITFLNLKIRQERKKANVSQSIAKQKHDHQGFNDTKKQNTAHSQSVHLSDGMLDDVTYIEDIKHTKVNSAHQYIITLATRVYDWDAILDCADYMIKKDLSNIDVLYVKSIGYLPVELTHQYREAGGDIHQVKELSAEGAALILGGVTWAFFSITPIWITWYNKTRNLTIRTLHEEDEIFIRRYVETMVRRTFGTPDAMKLAQPIQTKQETNIVRLQDQNVYIDGVALQSWVHKHGNNVYYEYSGVMPLVDTTPTISVYENGELLQNYRLETTEDENFSNKFFHLSVRLVNNGEPTSPSALIEGFISDSDETTQMTSEQVGYRFEVLLLERGSEATKTKQALMAGADLYEKALRYPGYTTPRNVRLVGVCQSCHKSFTFHGYSVYLMQYDVAYSDDGLDALSLSPAYEQIDKDTWSYEKEGKTFRYYNSFNCPHCGEPYIDYKKHPERKAFGIAACVLLGKKYYSADK